MTDKKEVGFRSLSEILLDKLTEGFEEYIRRIARQEIAKKKTVREIVVKPKRVQIPPEKTVSKKTKKAASKRKIKKRRRVRDADVAKMRVFFSKGYGNPAIAKALNFSQTAIRDWRKKTPYNVTKVTDRDAEKMAEDRKLGMPVKEISKLYGISKVTVYERTKGM